ncbi:unnamed protein product [Linum tenue]|uniref:Uncharacterized protein n=1 Tax=Linum tenue TaxID=586396 RepID=A0AAV0PUR4_9ROSI|nr:unnamed protein product [Linum tenue]
MTILNCSKRLLLNVTVAAPYKSSPAAEIAFEAASAAMDGGISVDVMNVVQGTEVLCVPGVLTPTEIVCAYTAGASIVKVYSVSALGGVQYIASLKKPFPHIPMVASQGITTDSVRHYITSAASAVVLSGATFSKEAMLQRNYSDTSTCT